MVAGVMLVCALIFSPLVMWDLYKKKKQRKQTTEHPEQSVKQQKTIIWWKAGLCGLVLISFFVYMVVRSQGYILPGIVVYPYYALCAWCLYLVTGKKIVFRKTQ